MTIGTYKEIGFDKGKYKYECEICKKVFLISHERINDKAVQDKLKAQCNHEVVIINNSDSASKTFNDAVSKVLDSDTEIKPVVKRGRKPKAQQ